MENLIAMMIVLVPPTMIVRQKRERDGTVTNPHVMISLVLVSNALMIMDVWRLKFVVAMTRLIPTLSMQQVKELSFEIMVHVLLVILNVMLQLVKCVVQDVTTPSSVPN